MTSVSEEVISAPRLKVTRCRCASAYGLIFVLYLRRRSFVSGCRHPSAQCRIRGTTGVFFRSSCLATLSHPGEQRNIQPEPNGQNIQHKWWRETEQTRWMWQEKDSRHAGKEEALRPPLLQLWVQEQTVTRTFFLITVKLPQWGGAPGNDASLITTSIVWFWSRQAVHVKCHDYFLIIKFAAVHSFALQMRREAASRYDATICRNPYFAAARLQMRCFGLILSGWGGGGDGAMYAHMFLRLFSCVYKAINHTQS